MCAASLDPTVYIPSFVEELHNVERYPPGETKKILARKEWITGGLMNEIQMLFPNNKTIDKRNGNERDRDAFALNAAKLFPVGRIFASNKQLEQAAELFCNAWAVKKTHPGKYIGCFYGKSIHSHK